MHYNPMGTVHGGRFAAMLDSALGCAVHSTLPAGKGCTTLEIEVNLVRALTDAVRFVRAMGALVPARPGASPCHGRVPTRRHGAAVAGASTTCVR